MNEIHKAICDHRYQSAVLYNKELKPSSLLNFRMEEMHSMQEQWGGHLNTHAVYIEWHQIQLWIRVPKKDELGTDWWLSARLQYLQYISNGDTAVSHRANATNFNLRLEEMHSMQEQWGGHLNTHTVYIAWHQIQLWIRAQKRTS